MIAVFAVCTSIGAFLGFATAVLQSMWDGKPDWIGSILSGAVVGGLFSIPVLVLRWMVGL
jgi:hypothetical protein